jgi:DNA-binding transcriptional regulator YdaS (Cro superfamily)
MGMQLLEFLKGLTKPDREAFAAKCGTSVDYLFQIAYGERTPKVGLVVAIERESLRQVRCEELLPEVDWKYLRSAPPHAPLASTA